MKHLRWSAPAILALVLSGCASTSTPQLGVPATLENGTPPPAINLQALNAAEGPGQPRIVTKDYSSVQVTGSLLATKKPNDPNAHALPTANPVRNMSAEDFERLVDRGLYRR